MKRYKVAVLILVLLLLIVGCKSKYGNKLAFAGLDVSVDRFVHDFNLLTSNDGSGLKMKEYKIDDDLYLYNIYKNKELVATIELKSISENRLESLGMVSTQGYEEEFGNAVAVICTILAGQDGGGIIESLDETTMETEDGVFSEYKHNDLLYRLGTTPELIMFGVFRENLEQQNELTDDTQTDNTAINEPTQEELNVNMKKEAIEADFVAINSGDIKEGTKLYLACEVMTISSKELFGKFTVSVQEGEDAYGVYSIINMNTAEPVDFDEGDMLEIWGVYSGKDDTGLPIITAIIIEKK